MKKLSFFAAVMCVAMAFTGCKSSESAYKKAYDKAKANEATEVRTEPEQTYVPEVTQVVETPVTQTQVVDNMDNTPVRQEAVSVVDGAGLKNFSVVVGSFSVRANAEGVQQRLKSAGYQAQLAYNQERNMYRVVASTFDSKNDAVNSRNQLRATYPDAWLLFAK
ncbi:MAG: SPOR domain-containing protein [Prevotella sp.]|nr:SPOR domain-containing protein [Prevotella sp.]MDY2702796.1 SPOR domain-containing protein [Prevotella sp.]